MFWLQRHPDGVTLRTASSYDLRKDNAPECSGYKGIPTGQPLGLPQDLRNDDTPDCSGYQGTRRGNPWDRLPLGSKDDDAPECYGYKGIPTG